MDAHLMNKLNDILRHEWTGVAQYAQAGFVVSGFWREVYASMFFDNAKESYGHARLIGDKIVALGGVPTIERNPVQQSNDLAATIPPRDRESEYHGIPRGCYGQRSRNDPRSGLSR